jgi:phenolic acid decarboxylase
MASYLLPVIMEIVSLLNNPMFQPKYSEQKTIVQTYNNLVRYEHKIKSPDTLEYKVKRELFAYVVRQELKDDSIKDAYIAEYNEKRCINLIKLEDYLNLKKESSAIIFAKKFIEQKCGFLIKKYQNQTPGKDKK